ncbi:response regulator receiver domain-containing protein [Ilumatobacter fluminis]|uniref:histidine kinase n=1 Tax=Ilumatobacter fluminis TaxID=467091 RepID=A0A4R7HUB0_9ACTN|nr:ATP-binding protein [Ilumatobacter fluminis]TDT14521.1 response regulator receiver domain-containing protein [Ilumatobacter fluminis]
MTRSSESVGSPILHACITIVVVISMVSIAGWQTHTAWMVQWRSSWAPMQQNTAIGELACALGLFGFAIRRWWVTVLGAVVALALGVVAMVQYVFDVDVGIDTVFVDPFVTTEVASPGRMSPRTALVLLLFGAGVIASVWADRTDRPSASTTLVGLTGGMVAVIPVLALMRRFVPGWDELWWDESTRMAVPTALGFVAVAGGLFAEAARRDRADIGKWLPGVVGAVVFAASTLTWRGALGAASNGDFDRERVATVMLVASCLVAALVALALMGAYSAHQNLTKAKIAMARLAEETAHRQHVERELAAEEVARLRAEYESRSALDEQRRMREVAERERVETELWKARRLEGLGHLAGGIAHDFNNVLQIIRNASELARAHGKQPVRSADGAGLDADLDLIDDATEQARRMIRQLLTFARDQGDDVEALDVVAATRDAEALLAGTIGRSIEMRLEIAPDVPPVELDRGRYEQLLLNLVVNARDAMGGSGRLCVSIDCLPSIDDTVEQVRVRVADTGPGIPDEIVDQLFDAFFTTKETGTGLGLSTVLKVAEGAGGSVRVASTGPEGTTFEVLLPSVPVEERPTDATPVAISEPSLEGLVVLVVDDDAILLEVAKRLLVLAGCEVIAAGSGADAVEIARSHDGAIDVVLTDFHMPELDGLEVATAMADARPDAVVVLMSGSGAPEVGSGAEPTAVLAKPFGQSQLRAAIVEALVERWSLSSG